MKHIRPALALFSLSLIALAILMDVSFAPAETSLDPLLGEYALGNSAEVLYVSRQSSTVRATIYDYIDMGMAKAIAPGPQADHPITPSAGSLSSAIADFNADGLDDFVSAWVEGPTRTVSFILPAVDSSSFGWPATPTHVVPGDPTAAPAQHQNKLRVLPGDFDRDPSSEFVIAYLATDQTVRILIYDADTTLTPQVKASISDETIPVSLGESARFDIAVEDFDGDGFDEILLVGVEQDFDGLGRWALFSKLYDVDPGDDGAPTAILPQPRGTTLYDQTQAPEPFQGFVLDRLVLATGRLRGPTRKQVVLGFQITRNNDVENRIYLQPFDVNRNLSGLEVDPETRIELTNYSGSSGFPLSLALGDLTGEGIAEVVVMFRNTLRIYKLDSSLHFTQYLQNSSIHSDDTVSGDENRETVAVVDLDATDLSEAWQPEIVAAEKYSDGDLIFGKTKLRVFAITYNDITDVYSLTQRAELIDEAHGYGESSMSVGNFDGDGARVGAPTLRTDQAVFQPLVVLNAPPVHFDVLNGTSHDVNRCFTGSGCPFSATYEEGLSQELQISTEVNADWALSNKIFAETEAYGSKVAAHLTATVGQKFSNVERLKKTITVGVRVNAVHDDMIYATLGDYDYWEYPVYKDGEFLDYMVVVVPRISENRWFPAKSWSGRFFIPSHEVGNVLSYTEYKDLSDNEYLRETIKGATDNAYTLGTTTDYEWRLEFEDFEENEAKETVEIGLEVGAEVSAGVETDFYGKFSAKAGVELLATYTGSATSTHTTSVKRNLLLKLNLGSIDGDEKSYRINPYAYWSNRGALVIDYAVAIEEAPRGFTSNWWQVNYGQTPDPAIALPWRYDPEKGSLLQDDAKRFLSRDLAFDVIDPAPGDTVTTALRVQNYSLVDTPAPVDVRFYIGDPDAGGILITGIDGESVVSTHDVVSARGDDTVEFKWTVPPGLEYPRIYAMVDPDNLMTEIHENNNKAWNVLGTEDTTPPTAIRLAYFSGDLESDGAHLRWGVTDASDQLGFHVYRATDDAGRERVTSSMLRGRLDYEYIDARVPEAEAEYWLSELSRSGITTWHGPLVLGSAGGLRPPVTLSPGYPNPFGERSTIAYSLASPSLVQLDVVDIQGRVVRSLVAERRDAGTYTEEWDGISSTGNVVGSGIYFVRLAAGGETHTRKLVRVRH